MAVAADRLVEDADVRRDRVRQRLVARGDEQHAPVTPALLVEVCEQRRVERQQPHIDLDALRQAALQERAAVQDPERDEEEAQRVPARQREQRLGEQVGA